MNADRWAEVERLCLAALERDQASRAAFLDEACPDDPDLRREVESLLGSQPAADGLFGASAIDLAAPALACDDEAHSCSEAGGGSASRVREPLARHTRLGPYEIDALIATGGMGEVYGAIDTRLRRKVAVKVLPPAFAADPDRLRRFQLEAEAVAALNHPNILAIHDIGVGPAIPAGDPGAASAPAGPPVYYLVTELLEGETLRERIARGPLPVSGALDIALPMARALAAAHDQHIVHRDIKPSNVFLTTGEQVKLLDFGIAKVVGSAAADEPGGADAGERTREATARLGTAGYMSPEQASGLAIDARSDIFAFGAVLYEMLTGRRAFAGDTAEDILSAILTKEPPPLAEACHNAPVALQKIVSRALSKRAEDRFPSARALEQALEPVSKTFGRPRRARSVMVPAAILLVLAVAGGAIYLRESQSRVAAPESGSVMPNHPRTAVAVLPLQNLSADAAHAYFAGGLHDEVITQLSKVAALNVIGRTSVMGYQGKTPPLSRIADELGVGTVVEGSVQVAGGRLRVIVTVTDATTNTVLWTDRYDRTLDDAFAIQSEVAQKVVTGVGTALSNDEQASLATAPTANPEAYRLYLQGRQYYRRPGSLRTNLMAAEQLFRMALDVDPGFALAHAWLSIVHGDTHWFRYDPSPARVARQAEEAEEARRLAPNLPETHVAIGWVRYAAHLDYLGALAEFQLALKGLPKDADLWKVIAGVNRRLGRWNEWLEVYDNAIRLNPRNADLFYDLGGETFALLHRYADAVGAYDRALSLAPDMHQAAYRRALAFILWQGRLDPMREMLNHLPEGAELGAGGSVAAQRAALLLLERDAERLLQMAEVSGATDFVGHLFFLPSALYRGWAHQLRGDAASARLAFGAALTRLDAAVRDLPNDWRIHAARGLALAGAARKAEAAAEARWLQQCAVYRNDAHFGTVVAEFRAQILAQSGSADAALDEIERLVRGPSWLSVHTLRLDPRWDPIRAHPRFQALLDTSGSQAGRS